MIAGQRINIEGRNVQCPPAPLYFVKSGGVVVDIGTHYCCDTTFNCCVSNERELWKMDTKGHWHLIRRMWCGREKKHGDVA